MFPFIWMFAVLALTEPALAQEGCFCLRDAAENLTIDCKKVRTGPAGEKTLCYDRIDERYRQVNTTDWTEIAAGQPGCQRCLTSPPIVEPPSVPRGDEEKSDATTGK